MGSTNHLRGDTWGRRLHFVDFEFTRVYHMPLGLTEQNLACIGTTQPDNCQQCSPAPDGSPCAHSPLDTAADLRKKIFRECVRKSRDKNEAEWERSKRA